MTFESSASRWSSTFGIRAARALISTELASRAAAVGGDAARAVGVVVEFDDDVGVTNAVGNVIQRAIELRVLLRVLRTCRYPDPQSR